MGRRNEGPAGPVSALQTAISSVCHGLGATLHGIAEAGEQHKQNACRGLAELGQRAGEQARRLQDHQQRHQQHALAGFAVRQFRCMNHICGMYETQSQRHKCPVTCTWLVLLTHKSRPSFGLWLSSHRIVRHLQSISLGGSPRRSSAQPICDVAYNPEEIKARLSGVPVYTVANKQNEFILVAGEVRESILSHITCLPITLDAICQHAVAYTSSATTSKLSCAERGAGEAARAHLHVRS